MNGFFIVCTADDLSGGRERRPSRREHLHERSDRRDAFPCSRHFETSIIAAITRSAPIGGISGLARRPERSAGAAGAGFDRRAHGSETGRTTPILRTRARLSSARAALRPA